MQKHSIAGTIFYKRPIPKAEDEFVEISIMDGFNVCITSGRYMGEGVKAEILKREIRVFASEQKAEDEFRRECEATEKNYPYPRHAYGPRRMDLSA